MNRRFRLLAALLALFALSAYIGESVWASMCPPGMETQATLAQDASGGDAHAGMHHGSAPSPEGTDSSRPDAPPCPLGMTGAGSTCVAVSLPAVVDAMAPILPGHSVAPLLLDSTHDLLLVASHFRPPRA